MNEEEIYDDFINFVIGKGYISDNKWFHFEATTAFSSNDEKSHMKERRKQFNTNIGTPLDNFLQKTHNKTEIGGGLYSIYEGERLLYIGRTATSIRNRIRIHFEALYNINGDYKYREYFKGYRNRNLTIKYLQFKNNDKTKLEAITIILERLLLHRDMPEFERMFPSKK